MATRVLSMSARLGPVPQPPAPQDEPVFAQLKPVLGAANPARDAALFPGEELKHPHHHPQAQPAHPQPPQPAPPPAPGPRLPPEELVQVGRAASLPPCLPPSVRACPAAATRGRQGPLQAGTCVGAPREPGPGEQPRPALLASQGTPFRREKVELKRWGAGRRGGRQGPWMDLSWPVRLGKVKGKWVLTGTFGFGGSPRTLRLHPPLLSVQ